MVGNSVFTRTRFDPRWTRQASPEPIAIGPISASEATALAKDTRLVGNEQVAGVKPEYADSIGGLVQSHFAIAADERAEIDFPRTIRGLSG